MSNPDPDVDDRDELEEDELDAVLAELEAALLDGDLETARAALEEARSLAGPEDIDVRYASALLAWEEDQLDLASQTLREVLEQDPDFADAHHSLALILEELGDEAGKVHHFLRTRALDAKDDRDAGLGSPGELDRIERAARETLAELPDELSTKLKHVPILLEKRPSRALVESGFDPRSYGLFEGPPEGDHAPAPTRIVLFTSNLLSSFEDEDLDEQVQITVLHEVGHYFHLDEHDMERLGLT